MLVLEPRPEYESQIAVTVFFPTPLNKNPTKNAASLLNTGENFPSQRFTLCIFAKVYVALTNLHGSLFGLHQFYLKMLQQCNGVTTLQYHKWYTRKFFPGHESRRLGLPFRYTNPMIYTRKITRPSQRLKTYVKTRNTICDTVIHRKITTYLISYTKSQIRQLQLQSG